jgi:hypothetical protein
MIRINKNTDLIIIHDLILDVNMVMGGGNSSAISTSKIMKITAIKKNRDEKCSRAELFGSNPHSNLFSRSSLIFFEINVANIIMTDDNMMVIVAEVIIIIIIYLVFHRFLDWKSSILSCITNCS